MCIPISYLFGELISQVCIQEYLKVKGEALIKKNVYFTAKITKLTNQTQFYQ